MNHRLNPGIGERVEKTCRWGNSRCNAFTDLLINEWPRSTPFNPGGRRRRKRNMRKSRRQMRKRRTKGKKHVKEKN